jgi:hypothetical protein
MAPRYRFRHPVRALPAAVGVAVLLLAGAVLGEVVERTAAAAIRPASRPVPAAEPVAGGRDRAPTPRVENGPRGVSPAGADFLRLVAGAEPGERKTAREGRVPTAARKVVR